MQDTVKIFKSKNGDLTTQIGSVVIERDNLKQGLENAGYTIKELKDRDIKYRDIIAILKAQISIEGSGSTILHDTVYSNTTDTIKAAEFNWNNRFLFFSGKVIDKKLDFDYKYKTGMDLLSTKSGKSYVVNAYFGDPKMVVTSGNSITITPIKRWWDHWYLYSAAGLVGGYLLFK